MSHIFDALQRSEGERAGRDSLAPSEATELLRNAERRAASKWETAVRIKNHDSRESTTGKTSVGLLAAPPEETAPAQIEPSQTDSFRDIFSQFQALQVTL